MSLALQSQLTLAPFGMQLCIERVFSRAKEWLLLDHLRVKGLEQVFIHACISFSAMLVVALTAVKQHKPSLIRCIKHYTTR